MPRYSQAQAREAIAASSSITATLRLLGMCPTGSNHKTLRKYIEIWGISTDHFDRDATSVFRRIEPQPLVEILVEGSTYKRDRLKHRLYAEGLKTPPASTAARGRSGAAGRWG